MNPEIARLAHEFRRLHLTLPPGPLPNFPEDNRDAKTAPAPWPTEWKIYFLSIREAREKAFLSRLVPSAAANAQVFHGVRGGTNLVSSGLFRRHRRSRQRTLTPHPTPLRPGEIGCDASHRKLWHELAAAAKLHHPATSYILCEDDVALRGDPAQVAYLRVLIAEATALKLDLVYLSWFQGYRGSTGPPRILSEHLRAPFGDYLQLWCIYVTPAGLEKLTREFPVGGGNNAAAAIPIDVAVRRSVLLRAAVAWPPLVWTTGEASDTAPVRHAHIITHRRSRKGR